MGGVHEAGGSGVERLFVAVDVGEQAARALDDALAPVRTAHRRLAWVRRERWHLTLAFVGEVGGETASEVDAAAHEAAARHAPLSLALDGALGMFGKGVLWAGLAPSDALVRLAEDLRGALEARDVSFDGKPFHAHLTVARARRGERIPRSIAEEFDGPTTGWRAERLVVMRSERSSEGLRYVPREVAPLGIAPLGS